MRPDNFARLKHILESINKIQEIFSEMDFDEFAQDWRSKDAVIRNFEIIGEAANRIDVEVKGRYPDVEWVSAIAMRNFLIHEYFEVDTAAVWKTINDDLPELKAQISIILEDIEE